MNYNLSNEIYSELIKGRYINKHLYDVEMNKMIENNLYIELTVNNGEYIDLYKKIGLNLENDNNSFHLERLLDNSKEIEVDQQQYKEYILLTAVCMYMNINRLPLNDFKDFKIGINEELIIKISKDEKIEDLLIQSDMSGLQKLFYTVLESRNIVFKNKKDNYVLSDIGKDFLDLIETTGKDLASGELNYE